MMHPTEDLPPVLKKLRMSGVLQSLTVRLTQAAEDNLSHAEFLLRLLTDEVERRDAKQLELRLRKASFEHRKTLTEFDFSFNAKLPKSKIVDLVTCSFIGRRENICFVGPTGVGKSHVAQAIGHRACLLGHQVIYTSARRLFKELRAARGDASYDRKLARYTSVDLLIVDDLGLHPLKDDEPHDLYEIIRQRYERASTIFTSNRSMEEWAPLFGDPLLATAAMDRLLHHAHVVEMLGDSYRNPPRAKAQRNGTREALETNPDVKGSVDPNQGPDMESPE